MNVIEQAKQLYDALQHKTPFTGADADLSTQLILFLIQNDESLGWQDTYKSGVL